VFEDMSESCCRLYLGLTRVIRYMYMFYCCAPLTPRQVKFLRQLQHPHVVEALAVFENNIYTYIYIYLYVYRTNICSADGSTHTESNKLYHKVKHRYRPNLSPRQRPTAKSRHDQAALAASAEARGATHRARPRSPSRSTHFTVTQRHR